MSDHKVVYLIIERGNDPEKPSIWRMAGVAYVCRDGSLNLKLDIHPGLIFNIRDPKSNGEREDAEAPGLAQEATAKSTSSKDANGAPAGHKHLKAVPATRKEVKDDIPF